MGTVISLLLFVAFANSTKQVTYSEIVSSLAQVSHVEGADAIMDAVRANWSENLKNLNAYNQALVQQCKNIMSRAEERAKTFGGAIKGIVQNVESLKKQSETLELAVRSGKEQLQAGQVRVQQLRADAQEEASAVQDRVLGVVERDRILRRLINIINDEITGAQRTATVGNYNVNREVSGITFLEVHNQLKGLTTSDPVVKSMISTLILITQDQKELFANQENVGKIRALIEGIIRKDNALVARIRQQSAEKVAQLQRGIQEASDVAARLVQQTANKGAQIVQNAAVIKFSETARRGMVAHLKRAEARRDSNVKMCNRVRELNRVNQKGIEQGINRFAALRQLLDA